VSIVFARKKWNGKERACLEMDMGSHWKGDKERKQYTPEKKGFEVGQAVGSLLFPTMGELFEPNFLFFPEISSLFLSSPSPKPCSSSRPSHLIRAKVTRHQIFAWRRAN
jgi:hypothetical protein